MSICLVNFTFAALIVNTTAFISSGAFCKIQNANTVKIQVFQVSLMVSSEDVFPFPHDEKVLKN